MLVHAGFSTLLVSLGESDNLSTPLPATPRLHVHLSVSSCFLLRLSHISLSLRQILVPVGQVCYPAGGEGSVLCVWTVGSSASWARRPVGAASWGCPGCALRLHLLRTWGAGWDGGQRNTGLVPGESGLSEGILKEPSFPHRGGGCEWDLQTVPGLQSQRQGMTGQGAHWARAAPSDQ